MNNLYHSAIVTVQNVRKSKSNFVVVVVAICLLRNMQGYDVISRETYNARMERRYGGAEATKVSEYFLWWIDKTTHKGHYYTINVLEGNPLDILFVYELKIQSVARIELSSRCYFGEHFCSILFHQFHSIVFDGKMNVWIFFSRENLKDFSFFGVFDAANPKPRSNVYKRTIIVLFIKHLVCCAILVSVDFIFFFFSG